MAACCEFEPKIQVDCVLSILKIIRSGDLISGKAELLQHAGCVIGCLGKYVEGSPSVVFGAGVDLPETLEECSQEVEQSMSMSQGMTLSPATVALILRLVQLLLTQFAKG